LSEPNWPETQSVGMEERGIKVRLTRQQRQLQEALDRVNAALEALESNPGVAELLEKVMKAL